MQRHLPDIAPRLVWHVESDEWLVLAFEFVDGRHADLTPGSADLSLVAEVVGDLSRTVRPGLPVLPVEKRWAPFAHGSDLALLRGETLVHTDLTAENILIGERVSVVDWAWPTLGAAWLDTALVVVRMIQAGHQPAEAEAWARGIPCWRAATDEAVSAFVGARRRSHVGRSMSRWCRRSEVGGSGAGAMSWDEAFADRYDEWSAHMTADVAFYVELARTADGPVVELAIGSGRVAIPVARVTGKRVIGVDSSPAMLEQARVRAAEAGVELDLREGDMRDFAIDEPAALIYCPFRALLHLPTWADRRRTFERVAASLRPGGRFAWNAFAFDHRIATRLDGHHQAEPVPHTNRYSVGDNRIDIVRDDGATSSLWWATKNEWLGLLDVAGLELEALYAGFDREPYTDDCSEYVFVARR